MKFDNVTQQVKVLRDQRLAARSLGNPTCKAGNGSTMLGETRVQGLYGASKKRIVVDSRIIRQLPEKADGLQTSEGSSLKDVMASH